MIFNKTKKAAHSCGRTCRSAWHQQQVGCDEEYSTVFYFSVEFLFMSFRRWREETSSGSAGAVQFDMQHSSSRTRSSSKYDIAFSPKSWTTLLCLQKFLNNRRFVHLSFIQLFHSSKFGIKHQVTTAVGYQLCSPHEIDWCNAPLGFTGNPILPIHALNSVPELSIL